MRRLIAYKDTIFKWRSKQPMSSWCLVQRPDAVLGRILPSNRIGKVYLRDAKYKKNYAALSMRDTVF